MTRSIPMILSRNATRTSTSGTSWRRINPTSLQRSNHFSTVGTTNPKLATSLMICKTVPFASLTITMVNQSYTSWILFHLSPTRIKTSTLPCSIPWLSGSVSPKMQDANKMRCWSKLNVFLNCRRERR